MQSSSIFCEGLSITWADKGHVVTSTTLLELPRGIITMNPFILACAWCLYSNYVLFIKVWLCDLTFLPLFYFAASNVNFHFSYGITKNNVSNLTLCCFCSTAVYDSNNEIIVSLNYAIKTTEAVSSLNSTMVSTTTALKVRYSQGV